MRIDDSTIPDIRAQLDVLREENSRLEERLTLLEKDVARLEKTAHSHVCEPHPSQSEVATLRIILRAFSHRLAQLEAAAPAPPPEKPHA